VREQRDIKKRDRRLTMFIKSLVGVAVTFAIGGCQEDAVSGGIEEGVSGAPVRLALLCLVNNK